MSFPLGIIDIGSNTVLMTCGRLAPNKKLEVLLEGHDVARLSEGLVDGGPLQPKARSRVFDILKKFKAESERAGIKDLRGAGTAAFRRASDGEKFAEEIEKKLGIPVQILSGDQEAYYSYLSAEKDFGSSGITLGMIDIGGGSTEIVLGPGKDRFSLPIGTVRLLEGYVKNQPIDDDTWKKLSSEIQALLKKNIPHRKIKPKRWVAVAATPTSLAVLLQGLTAFDPVRVHGYPIVLTRLKNLVEQIRKISVAERNKMPGMDPKRSDLLPLGGLILMEVMDYFSVKEIIASHHGLRYGLLWENLEEINE